MTEIDYSKLRSLLERSTRSVLYDNLIKVKHAGPININGHEGEILWFEEPGNKIKKSNHDIVCVKFNDDKVSLMFNLGTRTMIYLSRVNLYEYFLGKDLVEEYKRNGRVSSE